MRGLAACGGTPETRNDNFETPPEKYLAIAAPFGGFDLDVAASDSNHKCPKYFTQENSALENSWEALKCFNNPPYSIKEDFLEKAYAESLLGALVVNLLPNTTEAKWYRRWGALAEIWELGGRINYLIDGKVPTRIDKHGKVTPVGNTKGSVLIIYRPFKTTHSIKMVDLW